MTVTKERVAFDVDGERVVGHLYSPAHAGAKVPAVVVAGPMTSVKEQVTGTYAAAFAARGYVALAIDHRHFGESEGEPRQYEHWEHKTRDLCIATEFLASDGRVDDRDLSLVGVCLGAGYAAAAASRLTNVRRLGLVVGYYRDPREIRARDEQAMNRRIAEGRRARELYERTGEVLSIPAAASEGDAAMQGEDTVDYYTRRAAVSTYVNRFAVMSREFFLPFDVQELALHVAVPVAMVHSEKALAPQWARTFHERLRAPKSLAWLSSRAHTDFYDDPGLVSAATEQVVASWQSIA